MRPLTASSGRLGLDPAHLAVGAQEADPVRAGSIAPSAEHLGQRRPGRVAIGSGWMKSRYGRESHSASVTPSSSSPAALTLSDRPSGEVTNSGSRTSSKSRCSRSMSWWVLILGATAEGSPGQPPPPPWVPASVPRQRRTAAGVGQAARILDGTSPPGKLLAYPKEVIRLASANPRAVAWRLTSLRSFRQQRAGCSRELYRGGPGHRPRCAGGARRVPVASSARAAHGLSSRGARSHRRLSAPRAGALPGPDRGRAADRERSALQPPSARATSRRR